MKRIVAYVRVSTSEQDTLEAQMRDIKGYADVRNYRISQVFKEKKSAKKHDEIIDVIEYMNKRPQLTALYELIKKKEIDLVFIWKYDRLARDASMQGLILRTFQAYGTKVYAVNDSNDPLARGIMGHVAEYENTKKVERLNLKYHDMAAKGTKPGRAPPGIFKDKKTGRMSVPGTNRETLKYIFEAIASGKSLLALERENLKLRKISGTKKLTRQDISRIIRHPIYKGVFYVQGKEYKVKFEPIVDALLWMEVNEKIGYKYKETPWWLRK